MGDLLQTGATWLETQRRAHIAHAVTYARGEDTVTVLATVGRTDADVSDGATITALRSRDYLIAAADLELDGEAITPQAGDQVRETIGGDVQTFEVQLVAGSPCWEYSDPNRTVFRVHTRLIG